MGDDGRDVIKENSYKVGVCFFSSRCPNQKTSELTELLFSAPFLLDCATKS